MDIDRAELRAGLRATVPYLLAHHTPEEYDRCYRLAGRTRTIRLCARCLGIYPGILLGVGLGAIHPIAGLPVVAVGPAPALLDWTVTGLTDRRGANPIRTATGLLLGLAYGRGLWALVVDRQVVVLAVGVGYGCLAIAAMIGVARKE